MSLHICFFGLENLPVLAPEFNRHGIGGEQVQQTLLARALTRRGHTVSMVVHDYGQPDRARWDAITAFKAYREQAGLPVWRFVHPRWTAVWAALRRADAQIYYASCAGMHLGLLALFCRRHRRKLVFRVAHDTDCQPDQLLIQFWRDKKLYEYGLRRADGILVQSEQQRAALAANYGLSGRIAGMLVDAPERTGVRTVDVLWVNNIRGFKRPELFLALAERLPDLSFHMIGGPQYGHEQLYRQIARDAARLPNVTFHGRVPYHDMDGHFARARLFVNTSDSEGFPNAYLQAWVRGTPSVAFFDPDGVIETHRLGRAVGTPEQMADAVRALLRSEQAWSTSSANCLAYMARSHGEQRVLADYLDLFHGMD